MKKVLSVALVGLMLTVVLAGCEKDAATDDTTAPTTTTEGTTPEAPAAE